MIEYCPLTEENLAAAWKLSNRNLEFDLVPLHTFRHVTLEDPDFDPSLCLVAHSDGRPCGCIAAVCRNEDDGTSGGIKFIAVDEKYRNGGMGSELLSRVEAAMIERGAKTVNFGFTRPNYLIPGLDPRYTIGAAFLLRRGFTRCGDGFNMDVDLSVSDWDCSEIEKKLAAEGIICRRVEPGEVARLMEWMESEGFSYGWRYQVGCAAVQDPPGVFIAEKNGDWAAFASYDGVRPGWFGPMGTISRLRGGGIGSVTFLKCLQSMKAVGYKVCEINSVGPLYFYSKVANARVSRIFWRFRKDFP